MSGNRKSIFIAVIIFVLIGGLAISLYVWQPFSNRSVVEVAEKNESSYVVENPTEATSSEIKISDGAFDRSKSSFASQIGVPLKLQFMNLDSSDHTISIVNQPEYSDVSNTITVRADEHTDLELQIPGIYEVTLNENTMIIEYSQ